MNFFQNTEPKKGTPGMNRLLWAPVDTISAFPAITYPGVAAGDTTTGTGDFAFTAGNGWLDLKNDLLKGAELDVKSYGDASSPGNESGVKGRVLGLTPQLIEQFRRMIGVPAILLVQDSLCAANEWWVVGCKCDPAYMTFDFKSGTKGGNDVKGTAVDFKSYESIYQYTGAINLAQYIIISITINNS